MNVSKVYRVSTNMECECKKKDSKRRLFMSKMFKKKSKREFQKSIRKYSLFLIEVAISLFPTWIVSLWAIPAAYAQRGYTAIGGEWILIFVIFGLSYVLVSDWIDGWIRKERRKIERCRYVQNVEKELGL